MSTAKRIVEILEGRNLGRVSSDEAVWLLLECTIDPEFFSHLELLPDDIVTELKSIARNAPSHPEDAEITSLAIVHQNADEHDQGIRVTYYWAARRLREFYYPDDALPPFERIRLIGVISHALVVDGYVVIFGNIDAWFARKHPIRLIAPNGVTTTSSIIGMDNIERSDLPDSMTYIQRKQMCYGLFLADDVQSLLEVPVGTEVWVDRTAVTDIPLART
ncbi:MAG: hypothetical protein KDB05_29065 [Planctomycetales bacterium]|nr:hypothetical protein [Planctomycetales bacterium]